MFNRNLYLLRNLKLKNGQCGIPLLIKLSLHHKQDDSDQKSPLSQVFFHKLETNGPMFFKISQMQSVSILSISVQPCFSFLLLYFVYVDQVIAMCPPTFGHFECHEFFLDIAPFSLLLVNISAPRGFFTIVSSIWLSLPKMPISVNFQIYYWN